MRGGFREGLAGAPPADDGRGRGLVVEPLDLPEVLRISMRRRACAQGHSVETWSERAFLEAGIPVGVLVPFRCESQVFVARRGTLRTPCLQVAPEPQNRLVRVVAGALFAVAVDLRDPSSPTFGSWCSCELSAGAAQQLLVPIGFAFGFATLQPFTSVLVKADAFDDAGCLRRLAHDDPDVAIAWPGERHALDLRAEDALAPRLRDLGPLDFGRW